MNHKEDKFVRFHPDYSSDKSLISERDFSDESGRFDSTVKNVSKKIRRGLAWSSDGIKNIKKSMHFGSLSDAELSDSNNSSRKVLDPQGAFLQKWNKIFVISCVVAVSMDPLFFYIPVIDGKKSCLDVDRKLEIAACVLRFFTDIFYMIHIIFQFRTGFIAPSSRVFGRGVLVRDSVAIARRYMTSYFLIDILAVLPLPQVAVLIIIPQLRGSTPLITKNLIRWIVLLQYVPRFLRIYPLYKEVTKTSGIITETAWAGAAFNLFIYLLASHICGALWYLFSIERKDSCWRAACHNTINCNTKSLYCDFDSGGLNKSFLNESCPNSGDDNPPFNFGVYLQALQSGVVESRDFPQKLFYCFWWGLQSLSSLGQNLETSTYVWEIAFAVSISISGLVLFALLIGNMQTYLQSNTLRLEEMRVKRRDAEQWMQHRLLPANLRDRIRKYEQYKWQETRGVDEQFLLSNLPRDLRREIKSHLCLSLLRRVPMFEKMDDQLLDAMCDRLKPALYTNESTVIREGDPVDEMLFVMRGNLLSETTNGGRTGFMNRDQLKPGDFCGEELLTWALDPNSSTNLPISTRTVQSKSEVEGFVLMADDLKFVASQFRRLHSKQIRHTFRLYSHQWRTWAACFIQAAWRRHCKKKLEDALAEREDRLQEALLRRSEGSGGGPSFGATINVSRFATKLLRRVELKKSGAARRARMTERLPQLMPPKPAEPDFSNFTQ